MTIRETPDDWPFATWYEAAVNYKAIADQLGREVERAEIELAEAKAKRALTETLSAMQHILDLGRKALEAELAATRDRPVP